MDMLNKYMSIFSFILIGIFFVLGFLMIFSDYFLYIPVNYRIIFAALIISYGSVRLVATIYKLKRTTDEDDE
jgi:hypothetical protein